MLCPSLRVATLYTHLFETETMMNRQSIGLKGQLILARGKRSAALGWRMGINIVRAIMIKKEKILFRTREMTSCSPEMIPYNSVRMRLFALFIESPRTVFLLNPIPRAEFRIVPPETVPWAEICWPFRPEKHSALDLCIKISSRELFFIHIFLKLKRWWIDNPSAWKASLF
jgi:hypothetical protein